MQFIGQRRTSPKPEEPERESIGESFVRGLLGALVGGGEKFIGSAIDKSFSEGGTMDQAIMSSGELERRRMDQASARGLTNAQAYEASGKGFQAFGANQSDLDQAIQKANAQRAVARTKAAADRAVAQTNMVGDIGARSFPSSRLTPETEAQYGLTKGEKPPRPAPRGYGGPGRDPRENTYLVFDDGTVMHPSEYQKEVDNLTKIVTDKNYSGPNAVVVQAQAEKNLKALQAKRMGATSIRGLDSANAEGAKRSKLGIPKYEYELPTGAATEEGGATTAALAAKLDTDLARTANTLASLESRADLDRASREKIAQLNAEAKRIESMESRDEASIKRKMDAAAIVARETAALERAYAKGSGFETSGARAAREAKAGTAAQQSKAAQEGLWAAAAAETVGRQPVPSGQGGPPSAPSSGVDLSGLDTPTLQAELKKRAGKPSAKAIEDELRRRGAL